MLGRRHRCSSCAPRWRSGVASPLLALVISSIGILIHIVIGWPEGALPLAVLFLTYTVGAYCPLRTAFAGLGGHRGHDRDARAHRFTRARHGRRAGHPRPVHRRLGDRGHVAEPEDGDRLEGARGGGACRGGTSERSESARRGAVADRPGTARCGGPLDVGDRGAGRCRCPRARRPARAGQGRTRGDLHDLTGDARTNSASCSASCATPTGGRSDVPAHRLADLPQLVEDVRVAGVPVTLHVEGTSTECMPRRDRIVGVSRGAGGPHERDQARR